MWVFASVAASHLGSCVSCSVVTVISITAAAGVIDQIELHTAPTEAL
jgi:hypothetical protein